MALHRKLLLTSTMIAGMALLTPSLAAAQDTAAQTEAAEADATEEVVVTGSRIRRNEFTSPSPVEIITRDEAVLAGAASTTEILQGSTVTSGSAQIDNAFLGYVTEGGPGANTVSLRGLGAIRTLVLVNGRRLAPAGSRGQVGPADANVLPSAMVERIEILKDGASSIYGSDAVAGVINVITRNDLDGFVAEAFTDQTFEGGGAQYNGSLAWGKVFDRGNLVASIEYTKTDRLQRKDRDWASCATDYLFDPTTGDYLGPVDGSGNPICFPVGGDQAIAHNYAVGYLMSFAANRFTNEPGQAGGGGHVAGWRNVNALADRPAFHPDFLNDDIFSPTDNITFYTAGAYDTGVLGDAELYGEALVSRRDSEQMGSRQLSLNPFTEISYNANLGAFGLPDSPFFPTAMAAAGYVSMNPLVYFGNDTSSQTVDFARFSGGLRGDLGIKNWKYDFNMLWSRSSAEYTFESFLSDRIAQSMDVVLAPVGTPAGLTLTAPAGTLGAGGVYTCASNVGNPNASCVPMNLLDDAVLAGAIPQNLREWLFVPVTGTTEYEQSIASFVIDGDLFELPAGTVGAAFGIEFRHDRINDVPAIESQNGELYNLTTAGITAGTDNTFEVYGELDIPLVKNQPLAKDLSLNVSGRYTDVDSYGTNSTYKLGLSWTPVDFLRFRGTQGTSFRAPGLYELYLGDQSGFYGSGVDPCNDWDLEPAGTPRYDNCKAELEAIFGVGNANGFVANGGPEVFQTGGAGFLKAETSEAKTLGVIISPDFIDLSVAIDWFKIDINDQVNNYGTGILSLCYDDPDFRAGGGFCDLVAARDPSTGNLTSFSDPYVNVATQGVEGWDYTVRYRQEVWLGDLTANLRATHLTKQTFKLFDSDPLEDFTGLLRQPEWVGDIDVRYDVKDWTFRYGVEWVGSMDSNAYLGAGPGTAFPEYDFETEDYYRHSASVQYSADTWELTVGINNLFDEKAPHVSDYGGYPRVGDSLLYSGYDFRGRSAFVNLVKSF